MVWMLPASVLPGCLKGNLTVDFEEQLMRFRLAVCFCIMFSTNVMGLQDVNAGPAYMNDAETIQPKTNATLPSIAAHKFPRVLMAETQSLAGNIEQYSKYQLIATTGGVLKKVESLQNKYPDLMYFRQLMAAEFLGYVYDGKVYCSQSHGIPFENTASATTGCNVYAGHWLYQAGTTTSEAINSSATVIPVASANRFKVGQYVVIYDAPAGSFNNAEHAKITALSMSNNTLTVERGFKSTKSYHGAASIVAQHVTGQGGSALNWSFNMSEKCPKDSNGKTYNQVMLTFINNNSTKDWKGVQTSVKVSGFLFDSDFYTLFSSKAADVDNDLKTDDGIDTSGVNWWGEGLESFYQSVRDAYPNKYVIAGHQLARSFGAISGAQMEGWVQSNNLHSVAPEYNNLSSELANYRYYMHHVGSGPAGGHVLTKTPTKQYPDGTNASSNKPFRFTLGMGLLDDGYFGAQNSPLEPDIWYDEYAVITDKNSSKYGEAVPNNPDDESAVRENTGWLGNPLGSYTRIYDSESYSSSASLVKPALFDGDINGWSGVNVIVSRDSSTANDGSASLLASKHTKYQSQLAGAKIKGPSATLTKGNWYTLVFSAKASSPREIKANVGGYGERFFVGPDWRRYVMAFRAPVSGAQAISFFVGSDNTTLSLDSVLLFSGNPNVFRRDFDNGIVVTNATAATVSVDLGGTFQRIKGTQDSINNGQSLTKVTLDPWDAAILVRPKSSVTAANETTPDSSTTCGAPRISGGSDQGAFLWQDCDSSTWHLIVSPGGDSGGLKFAGSVTSDAGFVLVNPVGLESSDILNLDSTKLDFVLKVWNKGTDGVDMVFPDSSSSCFSLSSPTSIGVYLGPGKLAMPKSFDLATLQKCN